MITSTSPVQATGQAASYSTTATQPVEAPRVTAATKHVGVPGALPVFQSIG